MNNRGQVIGVGDAGDSHFEAFISKGGQFQILGVLPGMTTSEAYGINDVGQVVGVNHAFMLKPND